MNAEDFPTHLKEGIHDKPIDKIGLRLLMRLYAVYHISDLLSLSKEMIFL